jgi:hypothetical protein
MCTVSNVGDYYTQRTFPTIFPQGYPNSPTREEFELLRKSLEEIKLLLVASKRYDEQMGEPACEHEDKVRLIKQLAGKVGVDLREVFGGA